ncbi:hypothetical protein GEN90_24685 [Vibrio parahaemolyticus]|nr:hypothetical protein [Vibrio parahaemolyticus]
MASINWEGHQRKLEKSGLSLRDYCKNNNLNYNTARNKLRAGGVSRPEKVQLEVQQTKRKSCNLNAFKHGGYARLFAKRLVDESEINQSGLNQEIAVARMQTALVIYSLGEQPSLEIALAASEALQRLLGRIESLLLSQNKLEREPSNNADFLAEIFGKRQSGEVTATEAAYSFMSRGFDVPPALLAEMRLELGDDEEEGSLPTGAITPQMVEERERELQSGNVVSSEEFLQKRLKELEELNHAEMG